jgi:hypothetical protein
MPKIGPQTRLNGNVHFSPNSLSFELKKNQSDVIFPSPTVITKVGRRQ